MRWVGTSNEDRTKMRWVGTSNEDRTKMRWVGTLNEDRTKMWMGTSNEDRTKMRWVGTSNEDRTKMRWVGTSNEDRTKMRWVGTSNEDRTKMRWRRFIDTVISWTDMKYIVRPTRLGQGIHVRRYERGGGGGTLHIRSRSWHSNETSSVTRLRGARGRTLEISLLPLPPHHYRPAITAPPLPPTITHHYRVHHCRPTINPPRHYRPTIAVPPPAIAVPVHNRPAITAPLIGDPTIAVPPLPPRHRPSHITAPPLPTNHCRPTLPPRHYRSTHYRPRHCVPTITAPPLPSHHYRAKKNLSTSDAESAGWWKVSRYIRL
ncbi:hypothetical protein Btru_062538 [Bulinus truncatus]|nr:hypothetical protein Btru_062538 [Bulinus truncatus]